MLPTDPKSRKDMPMARGLLDYFANALAEVANVSRVGNEKHNPGQPLHWAKEKSTDDADCIIRHLIDRGTIDSDGLRHSAKVAWRALALLQREIEAEAQQPLYGKSPAVAALEEENAYPEGCEKCKGWTWDCHKAHRDGVFCGHECEYPITAIESSVYATAFEAGAAAAMKAAGRGDEQPLDYFCAQHKRWHRGTCGDCYMQSTLGSSR